MVTDAGETSRPLSPSPLIPFQARISAVQANLPAPGSDSLPHWQSDTDWRGSIRLDMGMVQWSNLYPLTGCGVTYAVHRYYRRCSPRRLPPLTPLSLKGIYICLAVYTVYTSSIFTTLREVLPDKDLLRILLAGDRVSELYHDRPDLKSSFQDFNKAIRRAAEDGDGTSAHFRALREGQYHSSSVAGKIIWWQHHMWSSRFVWNGWGAFVIGNDWKRSPARTLPPISDSDYDIVITSLANGCTEWQSKFSWAILGAFGITTPIAMLARWKGRPMQYVPMNMLQRFLVAAFVWTDSICNYRAIERLTAIRDKQKFSRIIQDALGDFEDEINEIRQALSWLN